MSPLPIIPVGVKRRPGIHAEALDSRFRGNDSGLVRLPYEHADSERIPAPRCPVISGAVKRSLGIQAEVLDSRFRGNDGGSARRVCEYADSEGIPAPAAPSFRAQSNGDPESTPRYWVPAFAGMTVDRLAVCVNALIARGYQPPLPRHSGRSQTEPWNPGRGIGFLLSRE